MQRGQIQGTNCVEAPLVSPTSSKQQQLPIEIIIAKSCIRAASWHIPQGDHLEPLFLNEGVAPKVFHKD